MASSRDTLSDPKISKELLTNEKDIRDKGWSLEEKKIRRNLKNFQINSKVFRSETEGLKIFWKAFGQRNTENTGKSKTTKWGWYYVVEIGRFLTFCVTW